MGVEVLRDEGGTEYTERVPDYPEPDGEPLCWDHHSNVCGCQENGPQPRVTSEATGGFSAEPPFPAGWRPPSDDLDLMPSW